MEGRGDYDNEEEVEMMRMTIRMEDDDSEGA